jgi:branched-chain amino acid transport system permease protein
MAEATQGFARRARWWWPEIVFWLLAYTALLMPPGKFLILNEIAILALFALSLDLILGYAGIVSLGHAAFFGAGAYAAGLLAKHVTGDPLAGLCLGIAVATAVGFTTSFLVLRGSDLTRLMVTLGVALVLGEIANALPGISGGADGLQGIAMGPLLGRFDFDLFGRTAYAYSLTTLFVLTLLARRIVLSPFGLSLMAIRRNALRAGALGVPVNARLIAAYTLAAAYAGARV